jgi:acyl carrier protein
MRTLKELIAKYSAEPVEISTIAGETNLVKNLGYDSLEFVQLISDIEDEYGISFDVDDLNIDVLSVYCQLEAIVGQKIEKQGARS